MKLVLRLVVALIVLLVVGAVGLFLYVDGIARAGIERGGTYALGVETTLQKADVEIFAGRFSMGGLHVANPEGFDGEHFLQIDGGGVEVTLGSLREDTVELPVLSLEGVDVVLESEQGKSNYDVILENLKRFESDAPDDVEGGKRFVIRKVDIRDVTVHTSLLPLGGDLSKVDLAIDRIELTDVGSESEGGVVLAELTGVILKAIFAAILQKGVDLPGDMLAGLQDGLGGLSPLAEHGIGVVTEAGAAEVVGGIGGEAGKAVDDVVKGLGGILGGDK